ncbi:sensor histidine kinase [Sphingomonas sp. Root1294]|nr:HWE histidine kinase domain-containing protein [Sphingomonas sp. Root1294]KQX22693.1 histidine kinase [Sphingomonas sp. Root1294]KQY67827.1 histidine kinase [Sphingomonas sp. Root50]KRB88751.1 histidine kinase [Sphingomonas sp. Root720]
MITIPRVRADLADAVYPEGELNRRPIPVTDSARDKAAILDLAARMVDEPEAVLPRFVELAMEIGGGVSAGFSLFEPGAGRFRWRHLHGSLAAFEDATTPRDFSPCGVVLDRRAPVLAVHSERAYDWISDERIILPEVLLVPLFAGDEPLGTLWVVSDVAGHFHNGHARSLAELAAFAGMALRMISSERALSVALEEQSLLAMEMNHRVKNLFAVADGMIRASARGEASKQEMADALSGRLHALASAHSLVSRHLNELGRAPRKSDFRSVLEAVLKPHSDGPASIEIDGPTVKCGDRSINGIALTFHELATNAAKYGALSAPGGSVAVRWEKDEATLAVTWTERGGPVVTAPAASGFGGSLLQKTITRQFHGTLEHDWRPDGLIVRITLPLAQIAA